MDFKEEMEEYSEDEMLGHNLQVEQNPRLRRVSFPENDTELVTGYLEPVDPLRLARNVDVNELLEAYQNSCLRHDTRPIETVVNQLQNMVFNNLRSDRITLFTDTLTHSQCESLEEILKRVQFNHIHFVGFGFTSEIAEPLFQMFEYYESALHIDINFGLSKLGIKGAEAVAKYLQESNALEELSVYHLRVTGREFDALCKGLQTAINLKILKLSNCMIVADSLDTLVDVLIKNETIKELYLPYNQLEYIDCISLRKLVQFNKTIQLLDLSNNHIEDAGVKKLVTGIVNGTGALEVLVLWSNKLTIKSAEYLSCLLTCYPSLTVLNVGCNLLRCEFISRMRDALITNTSLQHLGLQATELTCTGAEELAIILKSNTTLERVDLRENKILRFGLRFLHEMMENNKTLIQIDLSENLEVPDIPHSPGLIKEIQMLCQANMRRQSVLSQASAHRPASRKISLTSQTLHQDSYPVPSRLTEPKRVTGKLRSPAPSPISSPISSPIPMTPKSRFSVSLVSETDGQGTQALSRFKVSTVEPPKSVTSNSRAVTVGFECQSNKDLSTAQSVQDNVVKMEVCTTPSVSQFQNSDNRPCDNVTSVKNEYDNRTDETVNPLTVSDNLTPVERVVMQNISVPKPDEKPMTSLEKLLSLFQTPPFFTRNYQAPSTADKKESLMKTTNQLISQTFFPFANSNISKSVTAISNISDIDAQSVKENISPENSLSVFSPKVKSYEECQEKLTSQPCALDSGGVSKVKHECVYVCNSSEESDSCLTGLDSTTSSISVTDSGMNDESASTYDNSREVNADSQKSDLTNNNNSWKPANTNTDDMMETSVVSSQVDIVDWESDND